MAMRFTPEQSLWCAADSELTGDDRHDTMKLQVLGCAGGIGGRERFTTSLLVNDDILLDAGTGLSTLDIDQLARIEHVFITHCHLDHVAGLALLVDAVQGRRSTPITVYATREITASLKKHLFNWVLWPDFATIPLAEKPAMRWVEVQPGTPIDFGDRVITPHVVNHTAGSVAYLVRNSKSGFLFSGDMASTPALWESLRNEKLISKVIVDCSFANAEMDLAARSKHFCPHSLIVDIQGMAHDIEFLIYHLKPGQEDLIMQQLTAEGGGRSFRALKCGDVFQF